VISLYSDENVDRRIIDGLRRRGVDVLTAREAGLTGTVPDDQHLQLATDRRRVLLTGDTDLLGIAHVWTASGRPHSGVIFFHPGWTTVGHVVNAVHGLAHKSHDDACANQVVYVSWNARPTAR
jgi:predicted nuclease of predicted toxin-antitoxin system